MKKIIVISILFLITACTKFEEYQYYNQYFIDYDDLTLQNINTDLKVINIVVDQEEFDRMYKNYNDDIEIEAYFEMYLNKECIIENEEIELQIKGSSSAVFELKSLGVKFEKAYKNKENSYNLLNPPDILPFHSLDKIKSIRLRNSGNDFEFTMLKDITYTQLALNARMNFELMYAEQIVVFVNNKFYGLLNMRTETNKHGLSKLYNVGKKAITLGGMDVGKVEFKDGNEAKFNNFIEAIKNKDDEFLMKEVDVSNFIDYMIFESFIANSDWPRTNVKFFAIDDGPFRFVLFDLDLVCYDNLDASPMDYIDDYVDNPISDLFSVLYSREDFKNMFDTRYQDLLNSGVFSEANFNNILDSYKNNIKDIMPIQVNKYQQPETMLHWHLNIDFLKLNYKERLEYFNLSS